MVKFGTATLIGPDGKLNHDRMASIADQVNELRRRGVEVALVTSGAIGTGTAELKLARRPSLLPELQAAAAVGQVKLMAAYEHFFSERGFHAAQVLLTREDFDDRLRYLNASNALHSILAFGATPVINENDTVSTEEIAFGENDVLSALVSSLLRADILVILSVVSGLYDGGKVVPVVEKVTDEIRALATGERSKNGTGGMESKLEAARIATSSGAAMIVASGEEANILPRLMSGEQLGTIFLPTAKRMDGRKRWIGFGGRPKGRIVVDDGARAALTRGGKSLLPSGVTSVSGGFERGDLVSVTGADGAEFARGLVNYSASEVARIKGLRTTEIAKTLGEKLYDEVIHRDNLVVS